MVYQSSSLPSVESTTLAVSQLLQDNLCNARFKFQGFGYTGKVHHLTISNRRGKAWNFVIKGVTDDLPYRFYQDVLAPFDLNSPQMLGLFHGGDGNYLLMEFIPHAAPDWCDPARYRRVIEWLRRKDVIARDREHELLALPYVERFELGDFESRVARVRVAVQQELDPLLGARLLNRLERGEARFRAAADLMRCGPQTVTHNDLQMLNVLFGKGTRKGEVYVVDWTRPAVGSVCIDLATLLHVAPLRLRAELVQRYQAESTAFPAFAEILDACQMHVHLSILHWMIDAIQSGQRHAVHRPKLEEIVHHLMRYFA